MDTARMRVCRYINFGALSMNFLEVSQELADSKDDDDGTLGYDDQISAIAFLMASMKFC